MVLGNNLPRSFLRGILFNKKRTRRNSGFRMFLATEGRVDCATSCYGRFCDLDAGSDNVLVCAIHVLICLFSCEFGCLLLAYCHNDDHFVCFLRCVVDFKSNYISFHVFFSFLFYFLPAMIQQGASSVMPRFFWIPFS